MKGGAITDRVTLLADVAGLVSRSHDLAETLRNVVDLVARRLDADVCSVYLTDPDLEHLTLKATRGLRQDAVDRVRLDFSEGLVGLAAEQRKPIAIESARSHPRFRFFPEIGEESFESLMAAPLLVRDVPIGVLVVQTKHARRFSDGDVAALQTCAQLIAPVVMNAQLLEVAGRNEESRQAVVETLARSGIPLASEAPSRALSNVELRGIPASRGVAIGPVHILEDPMDLARVEYTPNPDREQERRDLFDAVAQARRELDAQAADLGQRFGPEFAAVFTTHVQILEDKGFVRRLEEEVARTGNAFEALRAVLETYRQTFERIQDPYFRDRGLDVEDVGRRVAAKLLGVRHQNIPLREGAVLVTSQILAAHFAQFEIEKVAAIVAEHGGATSHGAIFARSLEIPAVTGVERLRAVVEPGELAIVDGSSGRVYLSPDPELQREYERAQQNYALIVEHLDAVRSRPAETRDGRRIALTANVGLVNDLRLVERHGAEGVGLFRTELLALAHRGFPEEDEQEQLYERVAGILAPRPVTIRTLDLGGDKALPALALEAEANPQLGWRSIRLSLSQRDAFRAQLRAILRASAFRNVRLLLPLISSVEELEEAREVLGEAMDDLRSRGQDFDPEMPVGIMVEVPSAALIADALAERCDFLSIGTNDLTQYTLAVDRGNERVAHLFDPLHPAVLALIDRTVRAGERAGIPVSVCGESAADPLSVPLLVGLGIEELSATPSAVPVIKEIVRGLSFAEVEADAREALKRDRAGEVRRIAAARLHEAGLLEHPDVGPWLQATAAPYLEGACGLESGATAAAVSASSSTSTPE